MQTEDYAISNSGDLQQQLAILRQLIKTLLEYQKELSFQINALTSVKIRDVVNEVIRELNKNEKADIKSFDDLLILNAKMAIKKQFKAY